MRRGRTALLLGMAVVLAAGCRSAKNLPIRTSDEAVTTSIQSLENSADARVAAAQATVEQHHDGDVADGDFQLATVEFSDEGIAWRPEQRKLVLETVANAGEPNGAIGM